MRTARRSLEAHWPEVWKEDMRTNAAVDTVQAADDLSRDHVATFVEENIQKDVWNESRCLINRLGRQNFEVPRLELSELRAMHSPPAAARSVLCCTCTIVAACYGTAVPLSWRAAQQA